MGGVSACSLRAPDRQRSAIESKNFASPHECSTFLPRQIAVGVLVIRHEAIVKGLDSGSDNGRSHFMAIQWLQPKPNLPEIAPDLRYKPWMVIPFH